MEAFKKTIEFVKPREKYIVEVNYKDGNLSICANEYEKAGSTRWLNSSGGQCYNELLAAFPSSARLVKIWKQWHLNDMQAGCEHQANWDTSKELKIYEYTINSDWLGRKSELKQRAILAAKEQRVATMSAEELEIIDAPYSRKSPSEQLWIGYKLSEVETQRAGWVRESEHPEGLLCKPCEVCGYKYGSSWLKVEVPSAVLQELQSMGAGNE